MSYYPRLNHKIRKTTIIVISIDRRVKGSNNFHNNENITFHGACRNTLKKYPEISVTRSGGEVAAGTTLASVIFF